MRAGGFRSLAGFPPSLPPPLSFPLSHTNVCSSLALFKGSLVVHSEMETGREEGSVFLLSCLVHMFIVVEPPETDLKAVTAALDSDRESPPVNTAVPLLNAA